MRSVRSALTMVACATVLLPASVRAQKLDDEDKKFLSDVHPIILIDEVATFRGLKDKTDRLEFQKIFWARRDPGALARYADPATPKNAFQQQYLKDVVAADDKFRFAYPRGSSSDCGRFFILLGKPDEMYLMQANLAGLQPWTDGGQTRAPVVWIYRHRPGLDLGGPAGRLVIRFDQDCHAGTIAQQLNRVAATKIVHQEIGYTVGKDGHLVPLAEQLPKDALARSLLSHPRQDFPVAVQPSFLRTADRRTALLGLVRAEAAGLAVVESGSTKIVNVSVSTSAVEEDGTEVDHAEQVMKAPVGSDGAFVGSFKLTLKPGRHTLKAGVLDVTSARGAVATLPVDVPDLARVETAADGSTHRVPSAALLLVREIEDVPAGASPDAADPYAAFMLGSTRLVPHFGTTFHRTDPLVIFYQVYDLDTDRDGRADAAATVSILKGTSTLATHLNAITTPIGGSAVGPVPLGSLEPGRYAVRLSLEDRVGHRSEIRELPIEVVP